MNRNYLLVATICLTFNVTEAQTPSRIAKFDATGTGVVDSQIHDVPGAAPAVIVGNALTANPLPIGGEYFSIQRNFNGWAALRVSNNVSNNQASSAIAISSNNHGIGLAAYSTGYSHPTPGTMYVANTGVITANGSNGMNLGTTSNSQLSFWTNHTKRVTVDPNGNFGIGSTTPACKLEVVAPTPPHAGGMVAQFKSSGYTTFFTEATPAGSYNSLTKANDNCLFFDNGSAGNAPANGLVIAPWSNTTGGGIRIDGATGNVGINTNNATAKLTIDGNVLIGDPVSVSLPSPTTYKLYVQKGILTEGIKVALKTSTDWADYVFDESYKLKPLNEVKAFVKTNKHLPGVPSANDLVEQGGIDLGKMDAKLMEKIEELTLYIISLEERLNEVEKNSQKK